LVDLQHVKWGTEHEQTDSHDQEEEPDIVKSHCDKFDVEGCRLEELAPFENLDPKRNRSKGNDNSLI